MKKPLIIFLILIIPIISFSQGKEYKKIKSKKNSKYIEEYHVLKSNPKVKNGSYRKLSYRKKILEVGYYKNGIKDSTWIIYTKYFDSSSRGSGKYKDDKKVGVWSYYFNGKLDQKYNHSLNKIVYSATYAAADSIGCGYVGGMLFMANYLAKNVKYPEGLAETMIQGKVYVGFTISEDCVMGRVEVIRGVHPLLDEEAIRLIKSTPQNWISLEKEGKKVPVKYMFPINFR